MDPRAPSASAAGEGGALEREALRLCDRYVSEVILAFGLCPWAEAALRAGRVRRSVCAAAAPAAADCLPHIDGAEAAADAEIALVILPRFAGAAAAFDSFAERVRRADRARRAPGAAPPRFLIAAFHPGGAEQAAGPHQMVSFLRRSPDPMLQLVRAEALDRLHTAHPHASDEVALRNHRAIAAGDAAARFDAAVRAIHADRAAAYAGLGVVDPPRTSP